MDRSRSQGLTEFMRYCSRMSLLHYEIGEIDDPHFAEGRDLIHEGQDAFRYSAVVRKFRGVEVEFLDAVRFDGFFLYHFASLVQGSVKNSKVS